MDDWDDSKFFNKKTTSRRKFPRFNILDDVDSYLHTAESIDSALLKIISERDTTIFPKEKIDAFVSELLIRGAHVDAKDEYGNTPLHLAALMGYPESTKELLGWGADASVVNGNGHLPIELALSRGLEADDGRVAQFSKVAKMIIKEMEPARVRDIFITTHEMPRMIDFRKLLFRDGLQDAGVAVLDTLIEPLSKSMKSYVVNYSLLETNGKGEVISIPKSQEVSTFETIVRNRNKDVLAHPIIRLLIESRWRKFARNFFVISFIYWFLLMGFLTTALVLSALERDPRRYNSNSWDIFRGICEGITLLLITLALLSEFRTIYIWKTLYIKEYGFFFFSYITVLTALLLYILIPLRAVGSKIQWIFAAFAYMTHSLIAFQFLMNIRNIGKYVLILWKILIHDLVPFLVVFIVTLFTFTGALYLVLREEEKTVIVGGLNLTNVNHQDQRIMTRVYNNYPPETGSYPLTFLTGIRMMIEGNKIIDYYHSFGWLGNTAHLVFLFFVVVVLRSLLIAQMNHTYSTVQEEAHLLLIFNRARSIIFVQKVIAGLPGIPLKKWFKTEEVWTNPKVILQSTAVGRKLNRNKILTKLEQRLTTQQHLIEELREQLLLEHRKLSEKFDQFRDAH